MQGNKRKARGISKDKKMIAILVDDALQKKFNAFLDTADNRYGLYRTRVKEIILRHFLSLPTAEQDKIVRSYDK